MKEVPDCGKVNIPRGPMPDNEKSQDPSGMARKPDILSFVFSNDTKGFW